MPKRLLCKISEEEERWIRKAAKANLSYTKLQEIKDSKILRNYFIKKYNSNYEQTFNELDHHRINSIINKYSNLIDSYLNDLETKKGKKAEELKNILISMKYSIDNIKDKTELKFWCLDGSHESLQHKVSKYRVLNKIGGK